jgi:hypothetical protein
MSEEIAMTLTLVFAVGLIAVLGITAIRIYRD